MKIYYYVYKVIHMETNEFYFGSRHCKCLPEQDIKYKGSMKTWKPDKTKLIKTILKEDFNTLFETLEYESKIIKDHIDNPLNRNYNIPNKGFYANNMVTVNDKIGNIYFVNKNDPKYLSGELISINKGKMAVIDKDGKIIQIDKKDPRYLSGELIVHSKGRIPWNKNKKRGKMSNEQKRKISKSVLVALRKPEIREKVLKHAASKKGIKRPPFTEEHKNNMSKSGKGRKGTTCRKIICLNNDIIYESIMDCAKQLNLVPSSIGNVVQGKTSQLKGYVFKYLN